MKEYVEKIREKALSENRTEYENALEKYRKYLLKEIEKNSRDVSAVCQLAGVCYLIRKYDEIEILEMFLEKNFNILTDSEKFRIYIDLGYLCEYMGSMEEKAISYLEKAIKVNSDLGYYYDDQRDGSKRAIRTLRKAVAFNSNNSKAYYGLGADYYGAGKYDKSEEMYKRACELENNPIYKFEYANLLMVNGKNEEAKIILEELIKKDFEFGKEDFAKIKYSYIANKIQLRKFENIENEINELMLETVNKDDFFEEEFAELYYLAGSYEKSRKIYSKFKIQDYQFPAWWLRFYFYSLKQLNEIEKLQENFKIVLKIKDEEIESIKNGEFLTECTKSYKKEEIREIKRQIKNLKAEYEKILKTDYKPEVKIYPKFLYDCFLIDCPRHQKLDK